MVLLSIPASFSYSCVYYHNIHKYATTLINMTYKYNFPPEMQAVIDNLKTNTVHLINVNGCM